MSKGGESPPFLNIMPEENSFNDVGQQQAQADQINGFAGNFVSSLGSSLVNGGFGLLSQYLQNRYNIKNWEMQNEYNLPANQMERYKQAGISPSAAAQAITGGNGAQGAEIHAAGSATPLSGNSFLDALSLNRQFMLDKRMAEAEIERKEAEAENLRANTNRTNVLLPHEANKIQAEVFKEYSLVNLNDSLKERYDYLTQRAMRFEDSELKKLKADIANTIELTEKFRQEGFSENMKRHLQFNELENVQQDTLNKEYQSKNLQYENSLNNWKELYRSYFGANPDDPIAKQFLESSARGEKDALKVWEALSAFADAGVSEISKFAWKHPLITAGVAVNALNKWQVQQLKKIGLFGDSLKSFLPWFAPKSVQNPSSGIILPHSTKEFGNSYIYR